MYPESFTQLKRAYASGRTRPLTWRREQLDALRRMIAEHGHDFIAAETADLGKPASETVLMELNLISAEARFVRNRMGFWSKRQYKPMPWSLQPAQGWTIAEPKGVVLIIAPWNYPVLLALEPLADAIAAGNAVCIKPSELAPHMSALIAKLVAQYLDQEAITVVEGGPKETGELLDCAFDHIFYTGGERVGKIVMAAAAKHLTPVTLELGGKSPCFVDNTVDLNVVARRIAWGKFSNAGQTCVAPDYVLATPDIAEALAKRISVAVTEFYGENPETSKDYGRIINDRHFERLLKLLPAGTVPPQEPSSPLIKAASAVGAAAEMVGRRINVGLDALASRKAQQVPSVIDSAGRLVCGGAVNRETRYIAPTVLFGTQPDAPVMNEEIFGPILPILVVEDADAAIRFINARPRPLAAYVFSNRRAVRLAFERRISSGSLGYSLTLAQLLSSRFPFGGVGASGMGAYHGKTGFETFSHIKTVVAKPQFPDTLKLVYPPLDEFKTKLIKFL
ncbi:aldehyde dehydrogenase family protein [Bifidobacterium felsineum]|uniref:aldehyde dehydrogenase family protein n=1 Tax=Bifidobacterium felsineum TaxID=2045440 RepID=UPI001BDBE17B|nr:aldehyde dehydrogenase family protein [Bifidobacterium felsineum]MBT1163769.1 aldehyde dehydrogenase family protein [Bifidobacterium felsineum]